MSANVAPNIVRSELVLDLDAANQKSYTSGSLVWNNLTPNLTIGNLINGPTFDFSNGGNIVFDGTNDYIQYGSISGSFTSFTVEAWFYPTTTSGNKNVIDTNVSFNANTGNIGPRLEFGGGTGRLFWVISSNTSNNAVYDLYQILPSGLTINTWHYCAITRTSTPTVSTYFDGVIYNNNEANPNGWVGEFRNINIGRGFQYSIFGADRYFQGKIPTVRIYTRALTSKEVLQNYNAQKSRFGL